MPDTSQLLLLLDTIISQDVSEVRSAMRQIVSEIEATGIELNMRDLGDPLNSTDLLCRTLHALIVAKPGIVRIASSHDGSLPLHFAASLGKPQVAQLLLAHYPEAATIPNNKGKIPLHYAAREGRHDMVRFFLHAAPHTAAICSDKQKLALHFAAGDGHTEIVRDLLAVYPQGASAPSAKGKIPLHFAARWDHLPIAHDLNFVYPDGVRTVDWEGSLPLHDAAREGQYRMARYLMDLYPDALRTANIRDEIPLFPAVRAGNVDLIVLMVQAWPGACKHILQQLSADDRVEDWNILELLLRGVVLHFHDCTLLSGREPPRFILPHNLELITSTGLVKPKKKKTLSLVGTAVFRNLSSVESAPNAIDSDVVKEQFRCKSPVLEAMEVGRKKRTAETEVGRKKSKIRSQSFDINEMKERAVGHAFLPLHAALEAVSSFYVLQRTLEKYGKTRNDVDTMGRIALHYAAQTSRYYNNETICFLIQSMIDPVSASTRDVRNRLPLHVAIASKANVRMIEALLEACPSAGVEPCCSRDEWHNVLPVQMAAECDCDLSTVYRLLRADPSYVEKAMSNGAKE